MDESQPAADVNRVTRFGDLELLQDVVVGLFSYVFWCFPPLRVPSSCSLLLVFNQLPLPYSLLCFGFFGGFLFLFFCHEPNLPSSASSPQPASPPCSLCLLVFSVLLSLLKRLFFGGLHQMQQLLMGHQTETLHVSVPHRVGVNICVLSHHKGWSSG